jgi:hypothetical protein
MAVTPLKIKVSGADFSDNAVGRMLPLTSNRTNLIGEYVFGGSLTRSRWNGADPSKHLTVLGTPTYGSGFVTLAAANWFDTVITESQEFTALVIADAVATSAAYVTNFDGTNGGNYMSLYRTTGSFNLAVSATDSTAQNIASAATITGSDSGFRGLAMRTTGSVDYTSKLDQFESGVRAGGTSTTHTGKTRDVHVSPSFALGSSRGNAGMTGPINMAAALIWNVALSDAALLAAYQEARAVLAGRGIAC